MDSNGDDHLSNIAGSSYISRMYWDPLRGLTLVRIAVNEEDDEYQVRFLGRIERLLPPLFTMPPELITINITKYNDIYTGLLEIPTPLGKAPRHLFDTIIMNTVYVFSRIRWEAPWRGIGFGIYKIASTNTGLLNLKATVHLLQYYLARVWSSILCNSQLFEYARGRGGAVTNTTLIESLNPRTEGLVEECYNAAFKAFRDDVNGYSNIINNIQIQYEEIKKNVEKLAIDMLKLRDLYLISILVGKLNIISSLTQETAGVLVVSKQSRIESEPTTCEQEPLYATFKILFGDPTGVAVFPIITAISKVYGGSLWNRVPRLYFLHTITRDCKRRTLLEIIDERFEPPHGAMPSIVMHGRVESSLLMEAIDVYSSGFFFMPWERAAAITIFLRYLGRANHLITREARSLGAGKPRDRLSRFARNIIEAYNFGPQTLVVPLSVMVNGVARAIIFKQRFRAIVIDALSSISTKMIERDNIDMALRLVVKAVRNHIEQTAQNVNRIITSLFLNYNKEYGLFGRGYRLRTGGFRVRGIVHEVLNPIIDLFPDSEALARLAALEPSESRRMLRAVFDRLSDSDYTKIIIYYIIDVEDPGFLVDAHRKPYININNRNKFIYTETSMRKIAAKMLQNEIISNLTKDIIVHMSVYQKDYL